MCVNMFVCDHAFAANVPLVVHSKKKKKMMIWSGVCVFMHVRVPVFGRL